MARPAVLLVNPSLMRPPIGPIGLDYLAAGARFGYACDFSDGLAVVKVGQEQRAME